MYLTNLTPGDKLGERATERDTNKPMALADLIRTRGRLLSLLDLVALMVEFDVKDPMRFCSLVSYLNFAKYDGVNSDDFIDSTESVFNLKMEMGTIVEYLTSFEKMCKKFDLTTTPHHLLEAIGWAQASIKSAEMFLDHMSNGSQNMDASTHAAVTSNLKRQILDNVNKSREALVTTDKDFSIETASLSFYALEKNKVEYYKNPLSGWDSTLKKFTGKTRTDLEELLTMASECYALHQPTACVFHLCGAVEIGVRSLPAKFRGRGQVGKPTVHNNPAGAAFATGIPMLPRRDASWGNWVKAIENYASLPPTQNPPACAPALSRIAHALGLLQRAMRDQVSHQGVFPRCRLTYEEAKMAYNSAKVILQEIADLL